MSNSAAADSAAVRISAEQLLNPQGAQVDSGSVDTLAQRSDVGK